MVLATVIGGSVGQRTLESSKMGNGESKRHDLLVDGAGFPKDVGERVLVQGRDGALRADSPQVTAAVKDVTTRLDQLPGVREVEAPITSKDGRSVLVTFSLPGSEKDNDTAHLEEIAGAPMAAVAAVQKAHPELRVEQHGGASEQKALGKQRKAEEAREQQLSMGGTLLILALTFGALVAAGVPLLLGITSIAATIGLLGPLSQLSPLHGAVQQVVLLIGLAVGVDYAMFYLRRMTQEQDRGRSPEDALEVAAATSGRAVLISGFTVMAAMAGMFLSGNAIFSSFGVGTILVVAVAMLGSLTFLPAVLSYLGQKGWLEKGRLPFILKRRHRSNGESRVWNAVLSRVLARPVVSVIVAGGALVALSVPALGMHFKEPGLEGMSRSEPIIQTLDRIDAAFPGDTLAASVVVKAEDVTAAPVRQAIDELQAQALATGKLNEPFRTEVSPDRTVAIVSMAIDGKGTDAASAASLDALRDDVVPATVGRLPGAEVAVGGMTAWSKDFLDVMQARLPLVFGFVLTLAFVLLLVTFRSIVVPLKAIVLNLLSVGAAYGVLTLVFQDGHGESLLGFTSVGGITPWLPLFLFVVLFGLSMDYHVFVLSKVRELVDRGRTTEQAVAEGIKSTASVITSAAAVMVVTFAAFATGSDQTMKQLGVGLAAAVLIDATIVRAVLLPATMKLLGERNWWLPRRLGWLPKFEHEPAVAPA
ncbi:MMPL family transporter [Solirubrobacter phytolaccae]|uniref:MMPL family transporter n=1 Tax=Solirubrobacter phytolaccae TaxID=1404360 RepID=A0A9X3ND10_9ACTN|nr:MMPL family transporter [Solirubrobacter phytolaccae]MDA0183809.1 MMPL family transporter [Solirubrobacter phytolaccae]